MANPSANVQRKTFPQGYELITQGDIGDAAWLIESGKLEVVVNAGGKNTLLATIGKGAIVGEMALIDQGLRSATVRTLSEVQCLELSRTNFEQLIARSEPIAAYLLESFVASIRRAQGLPVQEWRTGSAEIRSSRSSAAILKRQLYADGYVFFRQGEPGETAYLIQAGRVSIRRNDTEIARLGPGRIFGKTSLVTGARRIATATAIDQTICEIIPKKQFDAEVAAMPPILRALTKIYAEQLLENAKKTLSRFTPIRDQ